MGNPEMKDFKTYHRRYESTGLTQEIMRWTEVKERERMMKTGISLS